MKKPKKNPRAPLVRYRGAIAQGRLFDHAPEGPGQRSYGRRPMVPARGRLAETPPTYGVAESEDDFVYVEDAPPEAPVLLRGGRQAPIPGLDDSDDSKLTVEQIEDALETLGEELKTWAQEWHDGEEEMYESGNGDLGDMFEQEFETWKTDNPEEVLAQAQNYPEIAAVLQQFEDAFPGEDLVDNADVMEVLQDSSNWSLHDGKLSVRVAQFERMLEEAQRSLIEVPDDAAAVRRIDRYAGELERARAGADWDSRDDEYPCEWSTTDMRYGDHSMEVPNLIDRALVLHSYLENNTKSTKLAFEKWVNKWVNHSTDVSAQVSWDKESRKHAAGSGTRPEAARYRSKALVRVVPNIKFETRVSVYGYAQIGVAAVVDELTDRLPEPGDTPTPRITREKDIARLSDTSQRLPFVFPPYVDEHLDGRETPCDWQVWNLSSQDLGAEGKAAKHCVGGSGYTEAVRRGEIFIWSVRGTRQDHGHEGSPGKTKFTVEVKRRRDGAVTGFYQTKGNTNRLPGWARNQDYPPYGANAYEPRAGLKVEDVRAEEVFWMMELIQQAAPLASLHAATNRDDASYGPYSFADWDEVLDALRGKDEVGRIAATQVFQRYAPDMLPGVCAVYGGFLFNAPTTRRNPGLPPVRMRGTTFDHPYRRER